MANVVPHSRGLNRRGLWRHTDKIIECYRDIAALAVYGGVVWGDNSANDHFVSSHGVITPDYLYKVIIREDGTNLAWLMPNNDSPTSKNGKNYLVSINDIERTTGATFTAINKDVTAEKMWKLPKGCKLS